MSEDLKMLEANIAEGRITESDKAAYLAVRRMRIRSLLNVFRFDGEKLAQMLGVTRFELWTSLVRVSTCGGGYSISSYENDDVRIRVRFHTKSRHKNFMELPIDKRVSRLARPFGPGSIDWMTERTIAQAQTAACPWW